MARWDKVQSRGDVEDRRSIIKPLGGLGIVGIGALLAFNFLMGGDLGDAVNILGEVSQQQQVDTTQFEGEDEYEQFAEAALGSANEVWQEIYPSYEEPTLVLFRQSTESACGGASSQYGPHYCPLDETIYLDETFFEAMVNRLGAEGGDVAEAYVVAHEVGHHVQYLRGNLNINRQRTNDEQIAIELQADCYAGVWAHHLREEQILLPNEAKEAIDAAAAVGDDRIQMNTTGQVNPESWTHGSSEQRVEAFNTGYENGDPNDCNY